MSNCAICDIAIDEQNDSAEHVIPNSIGGRLKVGGFVCRSCNNLTGTEWDSRLSATLNYFCIVLAVKRERGHPPDQQISTSEGKKLILRHNSTLTQAKPILNHSITDNTYELRGLFARSVKEAETMLSGIKRKYVPSLDVKDAISSMPEQVFREKGKLQIQIDIHQKELLLSITKTALAFAKLNKVDFSVCSEALDSLRGGFAVGFPYYITDPLTVRKQHELLHHVALRGDQESGLLLAYVEYFGCVRFLVVLSRAYKSPSFESNYSIDPSTDRKIEVEINWPSISQGMQYALEGKCIAETHRMAFQTAIDVSEHHRVQRERRYRLRDAIADAISEMGLPPGTSPPKHREQEFNKIISRELGDFSEFDPNKDVTSIDSLFSKN